MRVGKFTVRPMGPVMLKHVKAVVEILGLTTHGPGIWTRDAYICLHIARGRDSEEEIVSLHD